MPSIKNIIRKTGRKGISTLIKMLPKKNAVIVDGYPKTESSAITVANYIQANYDLPVFFAVSPNAPGNPHHFLHKDIRVMNTSGNFRTFWGYRLKLYTSKYYFSTQSYLQYPFFKKQVLVNIWHGILYKKVGVLLGNPPLNTDVTVGTSPLTRKMFAEAFGVPQEKVVISGYPRNDVMLQAQTNKTEMLEKLDEGFKAYERLVLWMPTYRKSVGLSAQPEGDGEEVGNPFYIPDFDIQKFNEILKKQNALCMVKPHPRAITYDNDASYSNVLFIDDEWVSDQKLLLYELVGMTDVLISDVSSIVIDYLLLDKPIICMSSDFETYKKTRGFYFEDIENWLPNLYKEQGSFFEYLSLLLSGKKDPYAEKRQELKNKFFTHKDAKSTERLVNHVLRQSTSQ